MLTLAPTFARRSRLGVKPLFKTSLFASRLVNHPVPNRVHFCYGLAVHLRLLSTVVLPRRSYPRSQAGKQRPDEDFHLAVLAPSQAHYRRLPVGNRPNTQPYDR
jgi:hypothetical protein